MKLYPTDPAYPRGAKRYQAIQGYNKALKEHGEDHPATRAALGRLWFHYRRVPQRNSTSIEAIAWERESGRTRGYLNRRARKFTIDQRVAYKEAA